MMRIARLPALKRVVRAALNAGVAISIAASGCAKKDDDLNKNPTPPSDEIASVEPLAQAATFTAPLDGAPNPNGDAVAFTAMTEDGAAVFRIPVTGGAPTRLVAGEPMVAPFGIVWSTDGMRLYVADSGAEDDPTKGVGRIFGMPGEGGTVESLADAEGTAPKSLDLVQENNTDVIYFTGVDSNKAPAVFKMNADGTNLTLVAAGGMLGDPSGITVDGKGVIYVADSSGENGATVFKIQNGQVSELATGMRFGHPAGIALVPSETAVLVSGLDLKTGKSTVYKVELASGAVSSFDSGISQNSDSAGLHRARNASIYAWANMAGETKGETITPGGTVYVLKGK